MLNRLRYMLLTILLAVAYGAAGQGYVIDKVCVGAERHYRIDGETGSTYTWQLTDALGVVTILPETIDNVTIIWNVPVGIYALSNLQYSISGCDSLQLGTIEVFELPDAYAGNNLSLCSPDPVALSLASASNFSSLMWTGSGDGTFDDNTALNPTYTFGPNDIILGNVTLTLTANGLGNTGTCPPAESSVTIAINSLLADISVTPASCSGTSDGTVTFIASGGTAPYTYTFDGNTNATGVFTDLAAGNYTYTIGDAGSCTVTGEAIVTGPPAIIATAEPTSINCSEDNGIITVTASGGTGTFAYMLVGFTGWQTENLFTALSSGTYSVKIHDATGCEITLNGIVVRSADGPAIIAVNVTNTTNGLTNGEVEIIANGTVLPLEYSLDGITWQLSNSFTGQPVGAGTAWVRDVNGCIDTKEYYILQTIDGVVEVGVDAANYCMNLPIVIPVEAKEFTGVASFTIELEFDPAIMTFVELLNEHSALDNGTFISITVIGNKLQIRYAVYNGSITIPGGEQLFSLHFEGLTPGQSGLLWNLLQCNIYSASGDIIPSIFTPGLAEVLPSPKVYASGNGVYCEGDTLTLRAGSLDNQSLNYKWTGPTGYIHNSADWQLGQLGMNDNGQFRVVATNPEMCNSDQMVSVTVNPKPDIHIGYADTICYGTQVLLDPGSGFASYLWQDGSTASSQLAYEEGVYWVQVIDNNSCMAVDTVKLMPCNLALLVPNAFTPNSDGLNDTFRPLFQGFEPGFYSMKIYSKWGQLLFTSSEVMTGWDGTIDGAPAQPGVYVYVISYEAPSYVTRTLPSPVIGDVTLLR